MKNYLCHKLWKKVLRKNEDKKEANNNFLSIFTVQRYKRHKKIALKL